MTPDDATSPLPAERSARRWARALYNAAFGTLPDDITVTTAPILAPSLVNFTAYPSANQRPLSIAVAGLRREPGHTAPLLALTQRLESALKLAIAPVTADADQPRFDDMRPFAAAIARGPAGAVTVIEHEPNRFSHHLPWLPGDAVRLSLPLPIQARRGLFIPSVPVPARLLSLDDRLELAVLLTPSRENLTARMVATITPPSAPLTIVNWTGNVTACTPPFGLALTITDPGSLTGRPFASASWVVSDDRFAIRLDDHTSPEADKDFHTQPATADDERR